MRDVREALQKEHTAAIKAVLDAKTAAEQAAALERFKAVEAKLFKGKKPGAPT
jgi:hypothetical protein